MRSASDDSVLRLPRTPQVPAVPERGLRHWWHFKGADARSRAHRDAIVLTVAGALLVLVLVSAGSVRWLSAFDAAHPSLHLEQWLPVTLVVASVCFAIYAFRRAADVRLQYGAATTDPLTGVMNRRGFMDRLHAELAAANRYAQPVSVVAFDLDEFGKLNAAVGLDAGDKVLREVADVVSVHLREADVLARWGGGEFRLLCPHTDLDGVRVVAERLRASIEERFDGLEQTITASFGVAERAIEEPAQQLLARADRRMYHAKSTGRNRLVG